MTRDVFQAIADPTRRAILMSLRTDRQHVNKLAEQFDITRQAVSLHVQYLEDCGVIKISKEGRKRYCEIQPTELAKVNEWMEPFKVLLNARLDRMDNLLKQLKKKKHGRSK